MTEKITENMNIREVIQKYPEVIQVFYKYNIGCVGCIVASFEKIKDIAIVHGIDIEKLIKDLNDSIKK